MKQFRQLGRKSVLTREQVERPRSILDSFENPRPDRDYEIRFVFPEFTSLCPVTGQPDFATVTVTYVPGERCVEMKSLKLYFFAYRDKGIFYEAVVNQILDDLVAVLRPRRMTVVGDFAVRGGTAGTVPATHVAGARRKGAGRGRNGRGRNSGRLG
jgi:7-cyano-7-deazaguanine reductase